MPHSAPIAGTTNWLKVSRAGDAVLIQVFGLGNMYLAPTLKDFILSELNKKFHNFLIDLKGCQGMDSTFMGTFVELTDIVAAHFGWFCLVNVSDDNLRLLKMLGVAQLISISKSAFPEGDEAASVLYPAMDADARRRQMIRAHEVLIQSNPKNAEIFGPFVQAVENEVAPLPTIVPPSSKNEPGPEKPTE